MTLAFGRREFLGGVAAASLLAGWKVSKVPANGSAAAGDLPKQLQAMADQMLAEYPENATILGIATGNKEPLNHRLTDRTPAGVTARAGATRKRLADLKALDLSDLGIPDNLDAAVALAGHELADEGFRFPFGDAIVLDPNIGFRTTPYVVNQLGGAFIDFPDFLNSRHPVTNEQEAVAYADRVDDYARDLDGETERLAHDRGAGVIAPDFTLDTTIKIISGGVAEKPDQSTVVTALRNAVTKAGLDTSIVDRVTQSVRDRVLPALQRQLDELKQHRAAATSDAGVWHFKDGDAYYQWALKAGTTTARSPDEIHQLGLEQVKAIQSRMESIMAKQGLTGGTVGERMAALGKDPAQLYPNTAAGREQLLAYLNGRIADVRTRLPKAFATLVPG